MHYNSLKKIWCNFYTVLYNILYHIYYIIIYYFNRLIGLVGRLFANGLGDLGSIPGQVIPKTLKNGTWQHPCLTLSIIRYASRVKWSNPGKEVAPFPSPRCSSYWKGSLLVILGYSRQLTSTFCKIVFFTTFAIFKWVTTILSFFWVVIYLKTTDGRKQSYAIRLEAIPVNIIFYTSQYIIATIYHIEPSKYI